MPQGLIIGIETSSTTLQQTRLGTRRAIRYTAIHIPRCKLLPGEPERRIARKFAAHTSATPAGGTPAATPAAQETTEERDIRGVAAEEPEVHLPAKDQHGGPRRSGPVDAGVAATLGRSQRQTAGIHYLKRRTDRRSFVSRRP